MTGRTSRSYVVTGGGHGIGQAITARLAGSGHVVVLDTAEQTGPASASVTYLCGDVADPSMAARGVQLAEQAGDLVGWVNNAAVFRDAGLTSATAAEILELVIANLALAVTGCHTAVNHFLDRRRPGGIVNISSHQAQRPVRGALPYATAKAAVEGLTKAVAVDHGPDQIRTNAVALGTIATARYETYRAQHPGTDEQMALLHPLGRVGTAAEVADAVTFLLSPQAAFINGVILPVDGGRAAYGPDPEAT